MGGMGGRGGEGRDHLPPEQEEYWLEQNKQFQRRNPDGMHECPLQLSLPSLPFRSFTTFHFNNFCTSLHY